MPNIAKPTKLKQLAGNPGKRVINKAEPEPKGSPVAPKKMSAGAKAVWKRLSTAMPLGVYTSADSSLLAAYCEAVSNHEEATEHLLTEPKMLVGSQGQPVMNPWFRHQSDQARLITTIGAQLGLSPTARRHINAEEPNQAESKFGIN